MFEDYSAGDVLTLENGGQVIIANMDKWDCACRYALVSLKTGEVILMTDYLYKKDLESELGIKII